MKTIADFEKEYFTKAYNTISSDIERKRSELSNREKMFVDRFGMTSNQFTEQTNLVRQKASLGYPSAMSYVSTELDNPNTPANQAFAFVQGMQSINNQLQSMSGVLQSFPNPTVLTPVATTPGKIEDTYDISGGGETTTGGTNEVQKFATAEKNNLQQQTINQIPFKDPIRRVPQPSLYKGRPQ